MLSVAAVEASSEASPVFSMFSNNLLPVLAVFLRLHFTAAIDGNIDEIIWTDEVESNLLTEQEHKVAFRDVVMESFLRKFFNTLMESSKKGFTLTSFPSDLLLKDPLQVEEITFDKKQDGLMDIKFKAWDLVIQGLHQAWIKNLHVLRHIGLKDVRVVVQLITDISFVGNYSLEGTGLSMIPLKGRSP